MEHLKADKAISYRDQCQAVGVSYSSVMRWRSRIRSGKPSSEKAGPKPVKPLDLIDLNRQIRNLDHGPRRTAGTGGLYRSVSDQISRRDFQDMVHEIRKEEARLRKLALCRIDWQMPGMAWAMDDLEYLDPGYQRKIYLNTTRDLASRYIFPPLTGMGHPDGHRIAAHLKSLFERYGPPLFLKRDNGSNLNHHAVNRVLADWLVIPVNSPPYYPPYNGGIERTQRDLKTEMKRWICSSFGELSLLARMAADALNHRPRPCLDGTVSCRVFEDGRHGMKTFHRRKRKEVFETIHHDTMILVNDDSLDLRFDSARRIAVQRWLWENGHVSIKNLNECYPIFSSILSQN